MQTNASPTKLKPSDLPLYCPKDDAHPRIFLAIRPGMTVTCPYCGTQYQLDAQSSPSGVDTQS